MPRLLQSTYRVLLASADGIVVEMRTLPRGTDDRRAEREARELLDAAPIDVASAMVLSRWTAIATFRREGLS